MLAAHAIALVPAQQNPVLSEAPVKVSEHVWATMGFPNVPEHAAGDAGFPATTIPCATACSTRKWNCTVRK